MNEVIYQCSKPVFVRNLNNLSAILKAAAQDAKTRNIDPAVLLNARLAPDMFPLVRQVQIATDHAKGCCARLAGVESPVFADNETTFAELEARIKRTLIFLKELKAKQFAGSDAREIVLEMSIGRITFNGLDYLTGWALPNFYFHYSATYNILRHNGVGIGKREYLGTVPAIKMKGKVAKMLGAQSSAKSSKKKKKKG